MKQDSPDQTLAQLFEQQRAADRGDIPLFARQCPAARPDPARLRRLFPSFATLVALPLLAVLVLVQPARREQATVTREQPIVSATAIGTWQAPTDSLLNNYAEIAVQPLPVLAPAWTDELLSPSRALAALHATDDSQTTSNAANAAEHSTL